MNERSTSGTRMLLRDNQAWFDPDGVTTLYWDDATKVLTPDGLMKTANISLSWNPDTDSLAIHRVHIIRADQVIDVLKTQHFTVLHRETNLERAAIDGRLTASLQITGLQVGDIVEIAASRRHRDPALGKHVEAVWNFHPTTIDTRLYAQWAKTMPIQWRAMSGLPMPGQTSTGTNVTLSMTAPNLREPVLPKDAPPRFRQANALQLSDWKDWAEIATLMAPLYAKSAMLAPGSGVSAQAAKIASTTSDPVKRAEAALALVQDQVRYLFVGLNDGGYVPAAAEDTWQRRYGDCKGKTVLLLALLRALGIEAQPVFVNATGFGDAIPRYLPAAGVFNHVLVRATIAGRVYWLDGTRMGDRHLADIQTPAFRWGLPIQSAGAALVPMMPDPPMRPLGVTTLKLDASAGVDKPVPVHAEFVVRGDGAIGMHRQLDALTPDARDRTLRAVWRKSYDYITPTTVAARFDPATGMETLTLDGAATLDWQDGALELANMQLGASVDFTREPGPDADAPFMLAFPYYEETRETIVLPDKGRGFALDPLTFDRTIAGLATHRKGGLVDGIVNLAVSRKGVAPEFPAKDAPAAQQQLRLLSHQHVYLRRANVKTSS
ncbi:DUF3857 domain-containing protein [Sphingomonas sp. PP-F2F-G114-C0414]|uniref:DUF3857 domain-containing protein n=1 Tax=Sphingomonas sp. PP-F2F-G114-C0414 TaxID=2135662 RepID=UPI0016052B4C|nr:DUF3857 domain-containing protein [Sphingomonas sp. PP-F2F-G114-C0414]